MFEKQESREIRRQIGLILMQEWDPIGVNDVPEASDEYDGYIGDVYALIERGATESEISNYLHCVELRQMELSIPSMAARDHTASSLKKLAALFA